MTQRLKGAVHVDVDDLHGRLVEPLGPVDGGQMMDKIDAAQRIMTALEVVSLDHVALDHRQGRVSADRRQVSHRASPKVVEHGDGMPFIQETTNEGSADEPRPAGDDDPHAHGWTRSRTSSSTPEDVRRNSTVSPVLTAMHGSASKPWP